MNWHAASAQARRYTKGPPGCIADIKFIFCGWSLIFLPFPATGPEQNVIMACLPYPSVVLLATLAKCAWYDYDNMIVELHRKYANRMIKIIKVHHPPSTEKWSQTNWNECSLQSRPRGATIISSCPSDLWVQLWGEPSAMTFHPHLVSWIN